MEKNNLTHLLSVHQHVRDAGEPRVSAFLGSRTEAFQVWRAWALTTGRLAAQTTITLPEALATAWIEALIRQSDLEALVVERVGFASAWRNRSPADLEARLEANFPAGKDRDMVHWLLRWFAREDGLPREALAAGFVDAFPPSAELPWGPAGFLTDIVRPMPFPALLVSQPSLKDIGEEICWLSEASALSCRFAATFPSAPVALAVEPRTWKKWMGETPESRFKSMLRLGLINLESGETAPRRHDAQQVAVAEKEGGELKRIALEQNARRQAIVQAAKGAGVPPPNRELDERARSLAESLLFEALKRHPPTAGLFRLNAPGGFRFGPREAEIDLLASGPGVAVEVDGFFHFLDDETYRRDRRKDFEMQKHGLLVMRFLATDVPERLDQIVAEIAEAVMLRRRKDSKIEGKIER